MTGCKAVPPGMEDVSGYPALFVELARRGYSQADLEKIVQPQHDAGACARSKLMPPRTAAIRRSKLQ